MANTFSKEVVGGYEEDRGSGLGVILVCESKVYVIMVLSSLFRKEEEEDGVDEEGWVDEEDRLDWGGVR
jgi:hypothetical protein